MPTIPLPVGILGTVPSWTDGRARPLEPVSTTTTTTDVLVCTCRPAGR
jgi:hypothetical protein